MKFAQSKCLFKSKGGGQDAVLKPGFIIARIFLQKLTSLLGLVLTGLARPSVRRMFWSPSIWTSGPVVHIAPDDWEDRGVKYFPRGETAEKKRDKNLVKLFYHPSHPGFGLHSVLHVHPPGSPPVGGLHCTLAKCQTSRPSDLRLSEKYGIVLCFRGHPEPKSHSEKKTFLQGPHRTILRHPKHGLHLVLSYNAIAKAFNVM